MLGISYVEGIQVGRRRVVDGGYFLVLGKGIRKIRFCHRQFGYFDRE